MGKLSTVDALFDGAGKLPEPSEESASEYGAKSDLLTLLVNQHFLQHPGVERLIGPGNEPMMLGNHRNHAMFMESIFRYYNPVVLVKTVLWVLRTYQSHGFTPEYWEEQLKCWVRVCGEVLSPEAAREVSTIYQWMLHNITDFIKVCNGVGELECSTPGTDY